MFRFYKYVNTNGLANYSIDEYERKTRNRSHNFIVYGHEGEGLYSYMWNCEMWVGWKIENS